MYITTRTPTQEDTFLYLEFLMRKHCSDPHSAAAHMKNIEETFGPEVTDAAMRQRAINEAAERGKWSLQLVEEIMNK